MAPKLYYSDLSAPSRSVLLTAKAIGLELDLHSINLAAGEQLKPEYLKINPQHTVPTLDDGGFILWDSHAINAYLVSKYAKDDSLYPKDLKKRALVDQRLHFSSGSMQPRFGAVIGAVRRGDKTLSEDTVTGIKQAYTWIDSFLGTNSYIAGNALTIADFSLGAVISSSSPIVPLDKDQHARVIAWFGRIQQLPYFQAANQEGNNKLVGWVKSVITC